MKVGAFIKWLETQDQNLEVCVMEKSEEWAYGYDGENGTHNLVSYFQEVCFDDPQTQSSKTQFSLILGCER